MSEPDAARHLNPLPPDRWDPRLDGVRSDMRGAPLNVHKLMAHNPALLEAWWSFRNHAVNGGCLGPRLGELAILRVGVNLAAWYEWGSHLDRSLRCGLTPEEIARVLQRKTDAGWPAPEAALLRGVDCLIAEHRLSERALSDLAEHFDAAQILDLIAIHGMYVTLGCMIRTWGLDLDADVAHRIRGQGGQSDFDAAARVFRRDGGGRS